LASSTSRWLRGAASLGGVAGLLAVWSGLLAGGPEQGLALLRGDTPEADARLLRLLVAARQGGTVLPLPERREPPPRPAEAELAELAVEPAAAGPVAAPEPAAEEAPPAPAPAAGAPAVVRRPTPSAPPVASTRVVPPTFEPGPVEPPRRVLRRDPLEPPLGPDGWREWVFAVTLNGEEVSKGSLVAEEPGSGRLAIPLAQLRLWRVRVDPARVVTLQGEPFLPLEALGASRVAVDREALTLTLELPPEAFETYALEEGPEPGPPPATARGAFLDYDLVATGGQGVEERLDGLVEGGLFGEPGVLAASALLRDGTGDPELVRLETRFFRDLPERRASLRLGDSLTAGGSFASSIRFGGIQWATNFALDPGFVTFPLPAIGGLAERPSVVDVFIDNLKRSTGQVPSGPFSFQNLPVVTGAGEVQLRVTDLLGRERILTQPYYVSARNLKEGLHEYSYEAGFERRRYGEASFAYGDAVLVGTHRYGLTDALTGELHGELQLDRQALTAGGTLRLGLWGTLTAGVGLSRDEEDGFGAVGQLAYEYRAPSWSFGARTRLASEDWSELGGRDGVRRIDQLDLGLDLGSLGRLGLLLANEERDRGEDRTVAAASWSLPIGRGALLVSAGQSLRPDRDLAITASYTLPLGERTTLGAEARLRDGRQTARLQARGTRGASDLGLDWRVGAEVGDAPRSYDARLSWQGEKGAIELEAERFDDENRLRLGVDGSLAYVDGTFAASRRLGQAFGLVDLPGFPNVRVYLDNREAGRTDAGGRLLLPGLRPWEANRVRLELDDLPLDARLERAETVAVPRDRSGVKIGFPLDRRRQATAILRAAGGEPLPAGLRLASAEGGVEVVVGRDGFAQITGPLDQPVEVAGEREGRRFACSLPAAAEGELLPDLGTPPCG
jgi:outer membrane usher protein